MEKANDSKILRVNGAIATDNSITLITKVNGKWYDAKINSKKITGNKIVFIVSLLTTPKTAHTITGIRLWDITGRICGGLEVAVKRTANQGVLAKFEFPIYEKGDE